MKNDPPASQTDYRKPRLRILSDNKELPGAVSAGTIANNYYQCDHFRAQFAPVSDDPLWWDVSPPLTVDIQVALSGDDWTSLIIGEVDHIQYHPVHGTIELEGRDLSARLIETKTQEAFQNQTASEVATTLAQRHGLTADVTKTTTLVGRYYEADHAHVTLGEFSNTTTEWDLLVYLAQREGFDVYVKGTTLYFHPQVEEKDADPYVVNLSFNNGVPRMNVVSLNMERSLTVAKDVQVEVTSWNSRHERAFHKTAKATGAKSANANSFVNGHATNTQKYVFVRPNLTEEQAQDLANKLTKEITLHERVVQVDMPGEIALTPRDMVKLQGTGTSFDQTYYIASIDRSISFDEGFRQTMRLKNTSPRSQTQV